MPEIEVFAPAKVNLALHVTGRRADGYHLLDSLVAFAPVGDVLRIAAAGAFTLEVNGPEADGVPADGTNLVARAVYHHAEKCGLDGKLALRLIKNLPPSSGIGGGSSDAAAALRGVMALCGTPMIWHRGGKLSLDAHWDGMAHPPLLDLAALGADVPMCFAPAPARTRGIGEDISPVSLPPLPAVLINPRVQVSTPSVFRALSSRENAPMPDTIPTFHAAHMCIDWLRLQRNDLEAPAISAAPIIGDVLSALGQQSGVGLARMSGSGATCFALFESPVKAEDAAATLRRARPDWWIAAGVLGDQTEASTPRFR